MDRRTGDALRLTATVAVLCIHSAGSFEWGLAEGGAGGWQAYTAGILSQLSRFSVPVFMILSGYGLAMSRIQRGESGWAGATAMWRRQFLRIGLPYVVFTVYGLIYHRRFAPGEPATWPGTLLRALLTGGGDYHLYFCSFLLQTYLVLPLLFRARAWVVLVLLLIQVALSSDFAFLGLPHVPAYWCVHWLGYAALGCVLARGDAQGRAGKWDVHPSVNTVLAVVFGAFCVVEYLQKVRTVPDPGWVNHFFRVGVMGYTVWCLLAWREWGRAAAKRAVGSRKPGPVLARLTGISFTVYLIHPTLLRFLDDTPLAGIYLAQFAALVVSSFAVAWLLDRLLPWRLPRLALGLPTR